MENENIVNQGQNGDVNSQPMTFKDWILTDLLLLIPIANIVLMFVWAFGKNVNKSKKAFFQAQLIICAVVLVLYIIFFGALIGSLLGSRGY